MQTTTFSLGFFLLDSFRDLTEWRYDPPPLPKVKRPKVKREPKLIQVKDWARKLTADFLLSERAIEGLKPRSAAKGLTIAEWASLITDKPKSVIESNSKLKKTKFWQFTLPAHTGAIVNGDKVELKVTCPMAGSCTGFCYACQGGYIFKSSMIAHTRNLQFVESDPEGFVSEVIEKIGKQHKAGKLKAFRIHDSGDFYSASYFNLWKRIIEALPEVQFYAYTKSVPMFKRLAREGRIPSNFSVIYSFGGKYDHLIDVKRDRHSKVFASYREMVEAGYWDTTETDANAAKPWKRKIGLVYHGADWAKGEAHGKNRKTLFGTLRYKWHQFLVWGEVK